MKVSTLLMKGRAHCAAYMGFGIAVGPRVLGGCLNVMNGGGLRLRLRSTGSLAVRGHQRLEW